MRAEEFIQEGRNDPAIFKAVFLAGGPGSGKSYAVAKSGVQALGFRVINSDDAFEAMLKKIGLTTEPDDIMSPLGQKSREKAKNTIQSKEQLSREGRLGLVIDGTGRDYAKIVEHANELREYGYDVAMLFVNTDVETALERNRNRTRTLPDDMVRGMWADVQRNLGKFQAYFGRNFYIVDNSDQADIDPALLFVFKRIREWSKEPPRSKIALKWLDQE